MMLSEAQKLLMRGLKIMGVPMAEAVYIVAELEDTPEQVGAMMEYMAGHRNASTAELLRVCEEISSRSKKELSFTEATPLIK